MLRTGKIEKILENDIYIAIFDPNSSDDTSTCSSGGCASCSQNVKKRLMKVSNPDNFPVSPGKIVEINLSTSKIFGASLRFFFLPLCLFFLGFYLSANVFQNEETLSILTGFSGSLLGLLFNFLIRNKSRITEMPVITGLL